MLPLYNPFVDSFLAPPPDAHVSVPDFPALVPDLLADWNPIAANVTLATTKVSQLLDASGNANTIGHGTDANRPTYTASNPHFRGHPSIDFVKASTTYLFGSSLPICTAISGTDKAFTVFAVVRRSTKVSADEYLWTLGNSGQPGQSYWSGGYRFRNSNSQRVESDVRDDAGTTASNTNGRVELSDLSPQVLIWSNSGTQTRVFVVGGTQNPEYDATVDSSDSGSDYSAQGAITFNRVSLGAQLRSSAGRPSDVEMARVLMYGRELTEAERINVALHLWRKYVRASIAAPTDLPGCSHWWDGSQLAGALGADVDTWEDLVGSLDFEATGFDAPIIAAHANGKKTVLFRGTDDALDSAAAADGNFLHNGANSTLAVVYRTEAADEAKHPILDTNGDSTTARGFSLCHNGASGAHQLTCKIGNGTQTVLNHTSQNYGSRPGAWHVAILVNQATVPSAEFKYHLWLDNEHYVKANPTNAVSASDAAGAITLGKLAGAGTHGKVQIAEIIAWNRALGSPGEIQQVNEYAARKWNTSHVALLDGNGLTDEIVDAQTAANQPNRAFPAGALSAGGNWRHVIYRRAATHGTSRGVGMHCLTDGIRRLPPQKIYDVDDAGGRDFRGECAFVRLQHGPRPGRLLFQSKWSADDSSLEVAGFPSTLILGKSDNDGGTWDISDPLANDPITYLVTPQLPLKYTASPNVLHELSAGAFKGRVLRAFTAVDKDEASGNQDVRLSWSDDAGDTWAPSIVIVSHDAIAWRVTEQHVVEFPSGKLLMLMRDDTNKAIYSLDSSVDAPLVWANLTNRFAGWGRPVCARDPLLATGVFVFYRSASSDLLVWRYSSDEGVTWSAERAMTNLHATTGIEAFSAMSYAYPYLDGAGNLHVVYSIDRGNSAHVFTRLFQTAA